MISRATSTLPPTACDRGARDANQGLTLADCIEGQVNTCDTVGSVMAGAVPASAVIARARFGSFDVRPYVRDDVDTVANLIAAVERSVLGRVPVRSRCTRSSP